VIYFFKTPPTNLDKWASTEGEIQTRDTVRAIVTGQLHIPPFDQDGTKVYFERNFDFPDHLKETFKNAGFGSPFRPDAWLIHGNSWCFVECKHKAETKDVRLFDRKIKELKPYLTDQWFRGDRVPPTEVVGVGSILCEHQQRRI
jgi:hypothetical protein